MYWAVSSDINKRIKKRQLENCRTNPPLFQEAYIDPSKIKEFTRRPVPFWRRKWSDYGNIRKGEWDVRSCHAYKPNYESKEWHETRRPSVNYNQSVFHQSMIDRYKRGKSWEETEHFKLSLNRVNEGHYTWDGCSNKEDLLGKGEKVDRLFHEIKNNGYKPQKQIRNRFRKAIINEVMIDLGRENKPLFVDGRHRLSIAKILEIDKIPVQICVKHELCPSIECGLHLS
ncbi:hypothetical protein [Natronorubrum sp. A-ect3]|uniref:hypothetical protein n=1 Tax=Natronorubrum sp. A-ect3 TaxID=3242698 RepID=UPI00359D2242